MDITALKESIPRIKHALEQNWDYCAMGIQQVTLRDPVFTRRGDFVCELELYASMFSDKSRVKSRILTDSIPSPVASIVISNKDYIMRLLVDTIMIV